jgi:hypothetical protein
MTGVFNQSVKYEPALLAPKEWLARGQGTLSYKASTLPALLFMA